VFVTVGSGNPVKRAATEAAFHDSAATDQFVDATVRAEPVDSGVSEQPRGHAETRRGAVTRAVAAHETGADLGVGIEGGVGSFDPVTAAEVANGAPAGATDGAGDAAPESAGGDLSLLVWAAVTDGTEVGVATGPSFPLPPAVARRVRDGEELGPVVDDLLDESGVARGRGTAGVVTGGRVDRRDALRTAVAGALAPFRSVVE
jgi:non-canonical (house-cleaning) NTP pyrophosphatase